MILNKSYNKKYIQQALPVAIAILMTLNVTGCGGSDSSPSSSSIPNPPNTNQPTPSVKPLTSVSGFYHLQGDVNRTINVGEQVGFLAVQQAGKIFQDIDSYQWKVIHGDAKNVHISAEHQPASSFVFDKPGVYTLKLTVQQRNHYNAPQTIDTLLYKVNVVPNPSQQKKARLRVDRVATSNGTVSLYFDTGEAISSDQWNIVQTSGPDAVISQNSKSELAQITLSKVWEDEVLTFEASLKADPSVKDTAYILLRPGSVVKGDYFCDSPLSGQYCLSTSPLNHHYAYRSQSPVADLLPDCVMSYKVNTEGLCHLAALPFIGQSTEEPTIDDIMDRVVVSHDWMGENFEKFLRNYDKHDDFKRLLRSTTAIVISDNVKPSFYWGGTGTMYLSADYLWMTPEQRDTLTDSKDYRAGYTKKFNYFFDFDYEKDNRSVLYNKDYYPTHASERSRSLQTIALPLASLLYHELAHANDYVSQQTLASTNNYSIEQLSKLAAYDMIGRNGYQTVSSQLEESYPLNNKQLSDLAQVWYAGQTPSSKQLGYSGKQVAEWFFSGRANDDYGYYTVQEDIAMMFEEAMMLTRFGVNRYVMVMDSKTKRPQIIQGQKNRITDPQINPRVSFVVSKILPEAQLQVSRQLESIRPVSLCTGTSYFDYYNTNCHSVNSNIPYSMKYRQMVYGGKVDDLGRPLGVPRHQTPKTPTVAEVNFLKGTH